MKPLPETPALLAVARRVIWFEEPRQALSDPIHFLAYLMTYGTVADLEAIRGIIGPSDFHEALDRAPPGIFDRRSWAYWNLMCGRRSPPPLPQRLGLDPAKREEKPTEPM